MMLDGNPRPGDHAEAEAAEWEGWHPATRAPWRVYCGDAREVLQRLAPDHYACAITSPPYYWQRDYGVAGQIGLERTPEEYVTALCEVLDGVRRVLTPQGTLFLNLGDTYYSGKRRPHGRDRKHNGRRMAGLRAVDQSGLGPPKKTLLGMPWRVALALVYRGWILRSPIIWQRKHAVPEPNVRDRPWRTYEFVFLFARSREYEFDRAPLRRAGVEDVWRIESPSRAHRRHPAVFPDELVERCLGLGDPSGGPVLDPFAGSGTVLRVTTRRGMAADGIELSQPFCQGMATDLASDLSTAPP